MKQINSLINKIDNWQQRHHFPAFVTAVIKKYGDDGAGYWAALLTYYGFLSLFPLLLVVTTLANRAIGNNPELEHTLLKSITDYFPLLGSQLAGHIHSLGGGGFALVVGILFSLYGARGVADVWRNGIQAIWGIPKSKRTGFPLSLVKSLGIIIIGGLGFMLASVSAGLAASAGHAWGFRVLSVAVNLFILFWLFTFLLNISLPRHVTLKETRVGAVMAAVGLVILQLLGGYILSRELKRLDALYSYFAIALGLLFWIYLQAQMLFYSAETAVVSSKKLWPKSFNDPPVKVKYEPESS